MNPSARIGLDVGEGCAYFGMIGDTVECVDQAVVIQARLLDTESFQSEIGYGREVSLCLPT